MTNQDEFTPAESEPSMELLDGAQAAPARSSVFSRVARGSLYGILMLSATALLAISAVPDLAKYASFIPDSMAKEGSCRASSGSCTALDPAAFANLDGTPCCLTQAATRFEKSSCSASCEKSSEVACASACSDGACAKNAECCAKAGCCENGECPLASVAEADEPPADQPLSEDALAKLPPGEDLAPISEADGAVE